MLHSALLGLLTFVSLTGAVASPFASTHPIDHAIKLAAASNLGTIYLNVHNSEDYIADGKEGSMDIPAAFEQYCLDNDGVNVKVTYTTFSVMEDELNTITNLGSSRIDLACVSDYIIQKLMSSNKVIPFKSGAERTALYGDRASGWEDNYTLYASKFLQNRLKAIHATVNTPEGKIDGNLGDYARGYMWGTLGLTYNPNLGTYKDRGLTPDDVKVQMSDWNALWSSSYNQTFQVKDSMRDTYAIGLMHVFDRDFKTLLSWYEAGKDNAGNAYGADEYNADVSTIFNNINHLDAFNALVKKIDANSPNYTTDKIVDEIQTALSDLKARSYGLEVDSGKTDIVDGKKSGIDTAWSGDAITSMNAADELGNTLYYSIPETGGNIWFDAWCLIKNDDADPIQQEYAQKFIDFLSKPDIAAANMDYIGYTSFIAGDNILSLVRQWYDPRTAAMYVLDENSLPIYDYTSNQAGEILMLDGTGAHDITIKGEDGAPITYSEENGNQLDFGETDMRGSTYEAPTIGGNAYPDWSSYAEKEGWKVDDLTYFFDGTLSELKASDMLFYTSELEEAEGYNLAGEKVTVTVGRQFLCQYPTKNIAMKGTILDQIPSLAVMEDYGSNNDYIVWMWENVKSSGAIDTWIIVLMSLEVASALGFGLYFFSKNEVSKRLRKRRREDKASA